MNIYLIKINDRKKKCWIKNILKEKLFDYIFIMIFCFLSGLIMNNYIEIYDEWRYIYKKFM